MTAAMLTRTRSADCLECGAPFEAVREWQLFCGDICRAENWRKRKNKSPPVSGRDTAGGETHQNELSASTLAQRETKLKRILAELARGRSLNRFQAEPLGDHCLHSTVAKIQKYDIQVARRDEVV